MTTNQPSLFDDADDLPHARRNDPTTSYHAGAGIKTMGTDCAALLRAYARLAFGATREEAADAAGVNQWAASKRVSDLRRLGLIEPRLTTNGLPAVRIARTRKEQEVNIITLAGRTRLHQLINTP
jgi:hypothetical protein